MKQEPVAYQWDYVASSEGDGFIKITMPIEKWNELIDIVDYTAPKELSVEEVENIYAESLDRDGEVFEFDMHRFADLILKKASEK